MINYLEQASSHANLLQLADDTKTKVYNDIKTFSMDGDSIQSAISDISNYWVKASGVVIEDRVRYFFRRIIDTKSSMNDDYLQKKLFALQILYGLITKSRSSNAGMLFEHYIAGILGKNLKMISDEQSPADIDLPDGTSFNIKLYNPSNPPKIKLTTMKKIEYRRNIFIIGFKGIKNLEIYIFDGTVLIHEALKANKDVTITLNIAKEQTKNPVIIDFENVINILINSKVSPALKAIRQTSDFLMELGDTFSKQKSSFDKAKGMHKDIGKTLKEVI